MGISTNKETKSGDVSSSAQLLLSWPARLMVKGGTEYFMTDICSVSAAHSDQASLAGSSSKLVLNCNCPSRLHALLGLFALSNLILHSRNQVTSTTTTHHNSLLDHFDSILCASTLNPPPGISQYSLLNVIQPFERFDHSISLSRWLPLAAEHKCKCSRSMSSPWKKQPEDVVDSVLRRAEVSKIARRLQNRLALAKFKTKHGWEDLTLDSIEPKVEEEMRRKRLAEPTDVLSDSSSSASDLPYPSRALMSSPLKAPLFSDAVGSSNGSTGHRKRTYLATFHDV
ncbi:cyclin-dependent kinase, partial [Fusarium austroafricanum]